MTPPHTHKDVHQQEDPIRNHDKKFLDILKELEEKKDSSVKITSRFSTFSIRGRSKKQPIWPFLGF